MLQVLRSAMIILGGIGVGFSYIDRERKMIHVIEKWEYIMHMFISEITYKKQPLSQASIEIGEKIGGKEGSFLRKVSERMQERKKDRFFVIWQEECENYCKEERISREEQLLLQEFGTLTGFEDEEIQMKMIEEQKEKWKNIRVRKMEEHQERKRLILVLSSCMGIMAVLILW